jgi:glycerophosphoryl diester phosphodiesterase
MTAWGLLFATLAFCSEGGAGSKPILPERGVCAHRGACSSHPENTLAAFREAIRLGVHQIEFDVRLTRDGQCVLMHDPTVDRTTNGRGKVADLTLEEVRRLDAGSKKAPCFAGEKVPTLREALAIMPVNIWLNVHAYSDGRSELGELAAGEIARQNRLHQAFLAADHDTAAAARRVCATVMLCNMDRRGGDVSAYIDDAINRRCDFIQLRAMPSAGEMAKLKSAGVRINYYYAKAPEELAGLFDRGVDFPLVNETQAMLDASMRLGIQPWKPQFR